MSEFGSGVVVCLAKFSQHLGPENFEAWTKKSWSRERAFQMVMYGASDHFATLDHEHAPEPLRELAAFTWRYRLHAPEDAEAAMGELMRLWRASCEAIDRELGATPIDWGEW